MLKYNCIVVEDEPLAAEVLTDYIQQVPFLELSEVCTDAIFAMEKLQANNIDLMFLDIHLPKLKGLDFLEALKTPPSVIITSAYKEYALAGYELNVIDYLLKPIRFNRFLKAVNKLNQFTPQTLNQTGVASHERKSFFFNVGKKRVKIFMDEILYIESLREYVRITTKDKSILTKFQLNEIEDLLSKNNFLRIHRSFIAAKDKIAAFTATDVEINNKCIPIGRSYKELVLSVLQND
ncbi:MAG TPA: LytTR family DNA-binding domain-containing protein [Parafilimonas sp.]|nr:LytTR family DNA-binding domain-containing protein [Parafilimonas sp.]